MKLENSVFVITGGGSGLGAATARRLVEGGARVVLADVDAPKGEAMAASLGKGACFTMTDVTDEASGAACMAQAVAHFGGLHGLVNCAGIAPGEKVVGREGPHGLASFTRAISINLIGSFNMLRLAAAVMSKAMPDADGERGVIINTASVAAYDGQVGQAAYASSKAGVVGMTLPIARELARFGIRVMTIAPGIFETPMMLGLPPDVQVSLGQAVPFPPRLGRPSEFADLVAHIIGNGYMNGETIRLDGAIRLAPR